MNAIPFYVQSIWRRTKAQARFEVGVLRSRGRLTWRALTGKPMVIVHNSIVVDDADIHGGIWLDKNAQVAITNCLIQDGNYGLRFEVEHG